jgi:hypothetical protein
MDTTITRRRSQRLFLQVRVVVQGILPTGTPFTEETHTIVVNAHGALVEMETPLEPGQIVTLRNVRTNEQIECATKLVKPVDPQKFSTAFEFKVPGPDFWRISFPPDDWSTKPSEPKKNP